MIPVTLSNDTEEKNEAYHNGTCIVCMQEITSHRYWRCPNSVCGDVEGPGRACDECYGELDNKRECPACRGDLTKNLITDPKLLPFVVNTDGSTEWKQKTLHRLIVDGDHFDTVLKMGLCGVGVLRHLVGFAISEWWALPLDRLQRLYAALDTAIAFAFDMFARIYGAESAIEAAKQRPEWLVTTAEWLTQWMDKRGLYADYASDIIKLERQALLLSLCENKQEFKALRRILTGEPVSDIIRGDVIDKYLDIDGKGQEWVMHAFLRTGEIVDDEDKREKIAYRLLTKFPCPEMYEWVRKQRLVIGAPSAELALKYHVFPIVYGCHSKGLYAQSTALVLKPVSFEDKHGGHGCCTLLPPVHPDVKQRVIYVDLAHDTMKLDWHTVHDIKTVDATSKRVIVELCEDGAEIYLDGEQLMFPANVPLKIVQFTDLRLKQKIGAKRKFLSI